jgi:hypothetical protein
MLLSEFIKDLLWAGAYSVVTKVGTWLDKKFDGPTVKVAIGMVLGLASICFVAIVSGLIGV